MVSVIFESRCCAAVKPSQYALKEEARVLASLSVETFHSLTPGLLTSSGSRFATLTKWNSPPLLLSAAATTASFSIGFREHVE